MSATKTDKPTLRCVLPWKALFMDERDGRLSALPCCANWINRSYGQINEETTVEDIWNGEGAQEIRRIMASGRQDEMCSPDCPWLNSGRFGEDNLNVIDGPPEFETNQRLSNEEIRERRLVLKSRPMAIRIIPTLRCNIRCRMCHQDHSANLHIPDGFFADLEKLAPYIYDYQLHGGEVLISPQLSQWADPNWFAGNPQMRLSLITNATHIPAETWKLLEAVRINYITVSVNAATRETYSYMAEADLFESVIENSLALRDLGRRHPLLKFPVYLSFVIMRCNYSEVPAFVGLARDLQLPIRLLLVVGNRLGESIYTDPPILDQVLAAVENAQSYCSEESLTELHLIQKAIMRLLNGAQQRSL